MREDFEKLKFLKRRRMEMDVQSFVCNPAFGRPQDLVEVVEFDPEDSRVRMADRVNIGYFYYYVGPLDEKTRDFCRIVLTVDKVFSLADIDELTRRTGYDVFEYEGSYNCRHQWVKFRGRYVDTPAPTDAQIARIARNSIFQ